MNGAEHICELLRELGVSHVFGLPGTQNVLLYEALRTRRLRSTSARTKARPRSWRPATRGRADAWVC